MFKKAHKTGLKIRLGVCGPAGSGKTVSSLATARGLGSRVALIDSEHGSSNRYADLFDFDVLNLGNRTIENYIAAIAAAGAEGYEVCIIDSLSHAWLAALEEIDRLPEKQRMLGWGKINPRLAKLKDTILGSPCHIIATFRAKTQWEVEQVNGKVKPREIGLGPVFREGINYEFDIFGLMSQQVLEIQKSRCPGLQGQSFLNPGKDFAELLKAWISGVPESNSSRPKLEEIWRGWKTPEIAIDWACERLPTYKRSLLEKLFNDLQPNSNGKRAPVWQSYVEELAQKEEGDEIHY